MKTAPFPAVVIGGPPHSGKSVLTYGLTQALRRQPVDHYVLRACPDGEGDWSNETPPETVRLIRNKGQFNTTFVERVCDALAQRHLPLLVDVGGRPTPEQEVIFDHCTHAILIAAHEPDLATWRRLAEAHHLTILAELRSTLTEPACLTADSPIIRGRIAGLERNTVPQGKVFECLVQQLNTLLTYEQSELRTQHLAAAPTEITVELERLGKTLGIPGGHVWQPSDLPTVLHYLPQATPLAVYGRGPGWLYAALASHTAPAAFWQFDARLGWVQPVRFSMADVQPSALLKWQSQVNQEYLYLDVSIPGSYLDYSECAGLIIPPIRTDRGVVISGKLPHWLLTGLVQAYQAAPWIGVYQPQLAGQAVVIASHHERHLPGQLVPVTSISV